MIEQHTVTTFSRTVSIFVPRDVPHHATICQAALDNFELTGLDPMRTISAAINSGTFRGRATVQPQKR